MLYDSIRVQLPTGELKDVQCPDLRVTVFGPLPNGYTIVATCGYAATNTVLDQNGVPLGWVDANDYPITQRV